MSRLLKKILAFSLSVILALSLIPASFATETADRGEQEKHGLGLLPTLLHGSAKPADAAIQGSAGSLTEDLPQKYDSRDYGYITPVKDQGSYNTCWAFATAASCEAYMIKHGVEVGDTGVAADQNLNLSEFHLAYYTYAPAYDAEGMLTGDNTAFLSSANTNFLDHGGTGELISYPLMRWTGLAAETEPALMYSSANYSGLGSDYAYQYNVAHVQSAKHFFGSNIEEVKRHIMEYGAGSMGVRVSNQSGTAYHGGVNTSNGTICWKQSAVAYQDSNFYYADHDVTVVGWDDTFSKENFNSGYQPDNDGAWIVKNSWGTSMGNEGYFYVSYEDSATCATYISFFTVEGIDNFDHNYQYDGSANYSSWEELSSGDAIAQQFVAGGNETLKAVALGMCGDNTDYTVRIYVDCTADDPTAGTMVHSQTGKIDYWGYQTIYLTDPVSLTQGQRFSVVFEFSGSDILPLYDTTYSENQYYNMQVTHQSHPNTAFLKHSGDSAWTNMSGDRNYRVKAYTKDVPEDPVPMTLDCMALGSVYQTISGTAGDKVNLPDTAPMADGWTFQGWVTVPTDETTVKPAFYKPGASYKLTASVTAVYALYMRAEPINAPVTYELITGLPDTWVGKYVFVATPDSNTKEFAMHGVDLGSAESVNIENTTDGAATAFENTGITRDGTTLSNVPETYVFEVVSTNYGLGIRSVGSNSWLASYRTGTNSTSYALYALKEFNSENSAWNFELDDDDWYLKNNNSGLIPYLAVSSAFGFSMTRYGSVFKFYKQNPTETNYYATNITGGEHTHQLTHVAAVEPTCGAAGNIEYWFCSLCGKYFSDAAGENEIAQADTVIPATGEHSFGTYVSNNDGTHSHTCGVCGAVETENCTYEDVVTEPTDTAQGYTTHTCTICGYSYVDSYTGPLGSEYPVHFSVPEGVTQPADMISNSTTGITLPTVEGPQGYTFLGWVVEDYDNVTAIPAEILTGTYIAPQEITLKALFSYVDGEGTGEAVYELVETAAADWSGNYVITYGVTSSLYIMKGVTPGSDGENIENSANCASYSNAGVSLTGTTLSNVAEDYIFTMAPHGGYYSVQSVSTGTYLGVTSSSYFAGYNDYASGLCDWTPGTGNNASSMKNANNGSYPYLSFTTNGPKFWTSSSVNTSIRLWKEIRNGTTYYTTIIGEAHEHDLTHVDAVTPACEAAGNIEYWYCAGCGKYFSDADAENEITLENTVIPATGHDWGEPTYVWADDNSTCTASRVCANDASHMETETAESSYEIITPATTEAEGLGRYTATFENVAFAAQTKDVVIPKEEPAGFHIIATDYTNGKAKTSIDDDKLYSGEVSFTVTCDDACLVAIDNGDGTYTPVICPPTDDGKHWFTISVTDADVRVVIAIKGDAKLDGARQAKDATFAAQAAAGKRTFTALQQLAMDGTGDGVFDSKDATYAAQVESGKKVYNW